MTCAILGALVITQSLFSDVWAVAGLSLVAAVAERGRVRLNERHEESISLLPTLFAAVLAGPVAGFAVGAASFAFDCRRPYARWATYTCTRAISGAGAGAVAVAFEVPNGASFQGILLVTLLAAITIEGLDAVFLTLTGAVRMAYSRPWDVISARLPLILSALPLAVPVVAMLVMAQRNVSPWTLPLFFAPALTAHRLFVMYQSKAVIAESLTDANRKLEEASLALATSLVAALDARDGYTAGHSASVGVVAGLIAEGLGLSIADQAVVRQCGLVHDIGKIGLPEWLLEKSGPLAPSERRLIEEHPVVGAEILSKGAAAPELIDGVLHHHERFDGSGYPRGLAGCEIPLIARILGVADAYDAMVSDRPYRAALAHEIAVERLLEGSGSQFDPAVVEAFLLSDANSYATRVPARCVGAVKSDENEPVLAAFA